MLLASTYKGAENKKKGRSNLPQKVVECIGEFSLIGDVVRSADAITVDNSLLMCLDSQAFQNGKANKPAMADKTSKWLLGKLRENLAPQVEVGWSTNC